eukprot:TRINITY_DN1840_c3_g5_i4.p1 TRINITY_DN1840_c3_g5~~TRINITY_DN1840_c3_g5_i4.p1  ORF type:complete len:530 (+),score=200.35 TRINITY_DN1840_c3_g5_i4:188-1591(+)
MSSALRMSNGFPRGHDLTLPSEHQQIVAVADSLARGYSLEQLRALEQLTAGRMSEYPTGYHIALKNAISKKLMGSVKNVHCTVVFAMYKEQNRICAKGTGEGQHPNGEDFIRNKHAQMSWLFDGAQNCTWSMLGVDDGCPKVSCDLARAIVQKEGYRNVEVIELKDGLGGKCPVLDSSLTKVTESQKGGAIIYGLWYACKRPKDDKTHVIIYTDSDLSTDLRQCGLNFDTILNKGHKVSIGTRFGDSSPARAVNCSAVAMSPTGEKDGVIPGLARSSIVHLTLRHKLRQRILPPLSPIVDTNCGHKGVLADAVAPVLRKVTDYKGSFDMEWLLQLGLEHGTAGSVGNVHGITPIAWVASVAESNFWGGGGKDDDPEAAKLKSAKSWYGIFHTMDKVGQKKRAELDRFGVSAEDREWADFVKNLDLHGYIRLTDALEARLAAKKELQMPEPDIMALSLAEAKKLASSA